MNATSERTLSLAEQHFMAMGTLVLVTIPIEEESLRAQADGAIAEVRKLLQEFGRDGWAWGSGALASFNRSLGEGRRALVPPVLKPLFARAWDIHQASGGLFEPRIGALVRLWGFDDMARLRTAPPDAAEIHQLLTQMHVAPAYHGEDFYGPAPGVVWDLGAIGKGYIVDLALDWLHHRGFGNAIINAGGNVAARGTRRDRPWHIGIRDPRVSAELPQLLAALDVRDESVITHGDDQRYFEHDGQRYAHLLHPHSGAPVHGLRSLTVVHADGTLADAGGAALFAAGVDGWRTLAGQLGLEHVLVVRGDGAVLATAPLAARLRPQADVRIEAIR
ncbi:MAG: FAD:protein transferase [Nevskia sp.]|nr:FAD:protein transferase [Nevskia sp.]